MKYKECQELVEDLREMADLLEAKGVKLPIENFWGIKLSSWFYAEEDSKAKMVQAAKVLGKVDKKYLSDTFTMSRPMKNGKVELRFETSRKAVCTKKVVKIERVPKRDYVDIPGEFVDKETVEWECDPLLS